MSDRAQSIASRRRARRAKLQEPTQSVGETGRVVRNTTIAMLVATGLLLVFNSHGLSVYARDLPPNAFSDQVFAAASRWHNTMQDVGLAAPKATVRDAMEWLRELTFVCSDCDLSKQNRTALSQNMPAAQVPVR